MEHSAKISPLLFAILHKSAHLPHCFYLLFGYLLTELWGLKDSLQTVKLESAKDAGLCSGKIYHREKRETYGKTNQG